MQYAAADAKSADANMNMKIMIQSNCLEAMLLNNLRLDITADGFHSVTSSNSRYSPALATPHNRPHYIKHIIMCHLLKPPPL